MSKKTYIGYDGSVSDGINFGIGVVCSVMLLLSLFGGGFALAVLFAQNVAR